MKLVFRPIMWLVSDEINGKTHMVVTNPAGTIVYSPQATEPPLPSLVPHPLWLQNCFHPWCPLSGFVRVLEAH